MTARGSQSSSRSPSPVTNRWRGLWMLVLLWHGAAAAQTVGKYSIVADDFLRLRPHEKRAFPTRAGAGIVVGETMHTGEVGVVQMLLSEEMVVSLAAQSSLGIVAGSDAEAAASDATLELSHGLLRAFVSRFSGRQLEVRVGGSRIAVRIAAAEATVESLADGEVRITCLGGAGGVRWGEAPASWKDLPPGHQIVLGASGAGPAAEPLAVGDGLEADLLTRTRAIPTFSQRRPRARSPDDYGPPPSSAP